MKSFHTPCFMSVGVGHASAPPTGPVRVSRADKMECGRRVYYAERSGRLLAIIRYFDKRTCIDIGRSDLDSHWAVLKVSGRTDRFDSFDDAKCEALKL